MDFRAPAAAARLNANATEYLTKNLTDRAAGERIVGELIEELGNAIEILPYWHPLLTNPPNHISRDAFALSELDTYRGIDHTIEFVGGFVTCPYSDDKADKLVSNVNKVEGLSARRLGIPLYSDIAFPVVVQAIDVTLEADGTICSRDALAWFAQQAVKYARDAEVAETWWNIRTEILGAPHGSRSSLFVNQHVGGHMRKILEALNDSGVFGPIKESSLDMLTPKKRDKINETLLNAALKSWNRVDNEFEFQLRDETCSAIIRDTWDDGVELSIRVIVGKNELWVSGFYEDKGKRLTYVEPRGKRSLAEKFI